MLSWAWAKTRIGGCSVSKHVCAGVQALTCTRAPPLTWRRRPDGCAGRARRCRTQSGCGAPPCPATAAQAGSTPSSERVVCGSAGQANFVACHPQLCPSVQWQHSAAAACLWVGGGAEELAGQQSGGRAAGGAGRGAGEDTRARGAAHGTISATLQQHKAHMPMCHFIPARQDPPKSASQPACHCLLQQGQALTSEGGLICSLGRTPLLVWPALSSLAASLLVLFALPSGTEMASSATAPNLSWCCATAALCRRPHRAPSAAARQSPESAAAAPRAMPALVARQHEAPALQLHCGREFIGRQLVAAAS